MKQNRFASSMAFWASLVITRNFSGGFAFIYSEIVSCK